MGVRKRANPVHAWVIRQAQGINSTQGWGAVRRMSTPKGGGMRHPPITRATGILPSRWEKATKSAFVQDAAKERFTA